MSKTLKRIRIFLASPGDVSDERSIARTVIENLNHDPMIKEQYHIEIVAWDDPSISTPMLATLTPQEAIARSLPLPAECDIVIVIMWSRMGTPLQETKPDGTRFNSGTEWEYTNALQKARSTGLPLIFVYKRTQDVLLNPRKPDFDEQCKQLQLVDKFFEGFKNPDGTIAQAYNTYETAEQFRQKIDSQLRQEIFRMSENSSANEVIADENVLPSIWQGSPFPGLRSLTPADEPIFLGRGRETDSIIKILQQQNFVAVVGASGSGKSSIVGAGVIPRLKGNAIEGSKDWLLPDYIQGQWVGMYFTPGQIGDNPFLPLAVNLAAFSNIKPQKLANVLAEDPTKILGLCQKALENRQTWSQYFFFIDQFEELFSVVSPTYLDAFAELLHILQDSKLCRIIVTLRSDFYYRCLEVPRLTQLLEASTIPLALPSQVALHEMIIKPAERAEISFELGLPEKIIDDTGHESGALALMAYTLDQLFQIVSKKEIRQITFVDYESIGGVQGAIGERAEKIFLQLNLDDPEEALQSVFKELVDVSDSDIVARKRAKYLTFTSSSATQHLVDEFISARLLVSSSETQSAVVEVAHEALFRSWKRLSDWIKSVARDLQLFRQVEIAAIHWHRRGRPETYLWPHERLLEVYDVQVRLNPEFSQIAKEFLVPEPERLLRQFERSDGLQRFTINQRLEEIGDFALPFLLGNLENASYEMRKMIFDLLRFSINEETMPYYLEAINDPYAHIRKVAVRALGLALQDEKFQSRSKVIDILRHVLSGDYSTIVRKEALEALTAEGIVLEYSELRLSFSSQNAEEKILLIKYIGRYYDEFTVNKSDLDAVIASTPLNKLRQIRFPKKTKSKMIEYIINQINVQRILRSSNQID